MNHRRTRPPVVALTWALLAASCQQPLPPEEPATQIAEPAKPVPVEVTSTQDPPQPASPDVVAPGKLVFKNIGLQTPESVLYHAGSDTYFVSNINGSPVDVDDNGFISKLKPDGSVEALAFITGGSNGVKLNAPKGMLIHGGTLLVTDIDHVRRFDLKTGAALEAWSFPEATFLNELTMDEAGTIYVTDSGLKMGDGGLESNGTDAIYRVVDGKISVLAKGKELAGPNGIAAQDGGVLIVTFGSNTVTHYDSSGKPGRRAQLPSGGLDGVVPLADGTWLISSWQGKAVYRGNFDTPFTAVVSDATSPADIGFDTKRQQVLIPLFTVNEVWAVPLAGAASTGGGASPTPPPVDEKSAAAKSSESTISPEPAQ